MLISNIETPALLLDLEVYEENARIMRSFVEETGLGLRPHYKSHKCTAIAHMQIRDGAKGLCCAKLGEAEDLVLAGIEDVLIANQIVDKAKLARVASLANCCYLTVCVDDRQNIADLSEAAVAQGAVIHCLVEYDIGQGRCGVKTYEEVSALAMQVGQSPGLVFGGIEAYAGHIAHWEDYEARKAYSEKIEKDLRGLLDHLAAKGVQVREVSGVSTGTTFFRTKDTAYTEIQPGSYLFMDAAYKAVNLEFRNALFVLATVLGMRGGKIITDAGLKSVSSDQRPPFFLEYPDAAVELNEEHALISGAQSRHEAGDRLHLVPSHCCTTVNLYDWIYFVRQGKVIDRVPVNGRGKSW